MTFDRWKTFSKREQLLFIGSEFERARVLESEEKREYLREALGRALALIDLSLQDDKWSTDRPMLSGLKSIVERFKADESPRGVAVLYQAL